MKAPGFDDVFFNENEKFLRILTPKNKLKKPKEDTENSLYTNQGLDFYFDKKKSLLIAPDNTGIYGKFINALEDSQGKVNPSEIDSDFYIMEDDNVTLVKYPDSILGFDNDNNAITIDAKKCVFSNLSDYLEGEGFEAVETDFTLSYENSGILRDKFALTVYPARDIYKVVDAYLKLPYLEIEITGGLFKNLVEHYDSDKDYVGYEDYWDWTGNADNFDGDIDIMNSDDVLITYPECGFSCTINGVDVDKTLAKKLGLNQFLIWNNEDFKKFYKTHILRVGDDVFFHYFDGGQYVVADGTEEWTYSLAVGSYRPLVLDGVIFLVSDDSVVIFNVSQKKWYDISCCFEASEKETLFDFEDGTMQGWISDEINFRDSGPSFYHYPNPYFRLVHDSDYFIISGEGGSPTYGNAPVLSGEYSIGINGFFLQYHLAHYELSHAERIESFEWNSYRTDYTTPQGDGIMFFDEEGNDILSVFKKSATSFYVYESDYVHGEPGGLTTLTGSNCEELWVNHKVVFDWESGTYSLTISYGEELIEHSGTLENTNPVKTIRIMAWPTKYLVPGYSTTNITVFSFYDDLKLTTKELTANSDKKYFYIYGKNGVRISKKLFNEETTENYVNYFSEVESGTLAENEKIIAGVRDGFLAKREVGEDEYDYYFYKPGVSEPKQIPKTESGDDITEIFGHTKSYAVYNSEE